VCFHYTTLPKLLLCLFFVYRVPLASKALNVAHLETLQEYRAARGFLKMVFKRKSTTQTRALGSIYTEQYVTASSSVFVVAQHMSLTTPRTTPSDWDFRHPFYFKALGLLIGADGHAVRGRPASHLDLYMQAKKQKEFALLLWQQLERDVLDAVDLPYSKEEFAFSEVSALKYRIAGRAIVFSVRRGALGAEALFADLTRLFNKSGWQKRRSWSMWQTCAADYGLHATDLAHGPEWTRVLEEVLVALLTARERCKPSVVVFPSVRADSDGGRTIKKNQWSKYCL